MKITDKQLKKINKRLLEWSKRNISDKVFSASAKQILKQLKKEGLL